MNSKQKSVGKIFRVTVSLSIVSLGLVGCASTSKTSAGGNLSSAQVKDELAGEISLRADRSALDELRREVPDQRKQVNDETALLLGLMGELKLKPSQVQEKYQSVVRKRREGFRSKVHKLRETFKATETKRRNEFLSSQKQERAGFGKTKHSRDEVKSFFDDLELKRRQFFAGESESRKDFESEVTSQSKDFEAYVREKNAEFNEQFRIYSRRYSESEREKTRELEKKRLESKSKTGAGRANVRPQNTPEPSPTEQAFGVAPSPGEEPEATGTPSGQPDMSEFEEMNNKPAQALAPQGSSKSK